MTRGPVRLAVLEHNADGTPCSGVFGDVYHPASGALAQAEHVFVRGHDLPQRWQQRDRFVVLETGFGLGSNFLATWAAWRGDAQRCQRLDFISIEASPLTAADLRELHRGSPLEPLAAQLLDAWPPATPDLHLLAFDDGRVRLLLALGDVARWLPQIDARVDAFDLDGFAPARNPAMWEPRLFKAMARLAAPGATVATWTAARAVREGLAAAGFEVQIAPGQGGKRDITLARFAPRHAPRTLLARGGGVREAVIVGAGLAGCAAAAALARAGVASLVLDRGPGAATEASGNPAGLFHGVVHADDGPHARFGRAAARIASGVVARAIAAHGVGGATAGALRLVTDGTDVDALSAMALRLGLPPEVAAPIDSRSASDRAGLPLAHPAWLHPGGGWADPAALARSLLSGAGAAVTLRTGTQVAQLRRDGEHWLLIDTGGAVITRSGCVVLANASDALRLAPGADWPVQPVRGQLSWIEAAAAGSRPLPTLPVAGAGYVLPAVGGRIVFGATQDGDDADPALRASDHARNVAQLGRLCAAWAGLDVMQLGGRVGWRAVAADRLPLVGAVPDDAARDVRRDQPRFAGRQRGLYPHTALGSRGVASAPLAAEMLAAWITGAPMPVAADLRDALDPARFAVRRYRAGGR